MALILALLMFVLMWRYGVDHNAGRPWFAHRRPRRKLRPSIPPSAPSVVRKRVNPPAMRSPQPMQSRPWYFPQSEKPVPLNQEHPAPSLPGKAGAHSLSGQASKKPASEPPSATDRPWYFPQPVKAPDYFTPLQTQPLVVPQVLLLKLTSLTRDQAAAQRLIEQVAQRNPDRDGQWVAEKVIRDLERDRL